MTKVIVKNNHPCSECKKDIPAGSEAYYEEHLFCSEECAKRHENRWTRAFKEVYGDGTKL